MQQQYQFQTTIAVSRGGTCCRCVLLLHAVRGDIKSTAVPHTSDVQRCCCSSTSNNVAMLRLHRAARLQASDLVSLSPAAHSPSTHTRPCTQLGMQLTCCSMQQWSGRDDPLSQRNTAVADSTIKLLIRLSTKIWAEPKQRTLWPTIAMGFRNKTLDPSANPPP